MKGHIFKKNTKKPQESHNLKNGGCAGKFQKLKKFRAYTVS
jgi:hypothetical protein